MMLISLVYIFLKIWMVLQANSVFKSLGECPAPPLVGAAEAIRLSLRKIMEMVAIMSIIAGIFTLLVKIYYISLASSRVRTKRSYKSGIRPTRWNIVTKPVLVILCGSVVVVTDVLGLGALLLARPVQLVDQVNVVVTGGHCVGRDKVQTLRTLAVTSTLIYLLILVLGHYMGLARRYKQMKHKRCSSERAGEHEKRSDCEYEKHHNCHDERYSSSSCYSSDEC